MGCTSCKKKKPVTKLEPILQETVWVPTKEEIKLAYAELTSLLGVKEDKKEFINNVYKFLFNEDFDFNCKGCSNGKVRRFKNYLNTI